MEMRTYPLNMIDYEAEDAELFHCTRTSGVWAEDSFTITNIGNNKITVGEGIAWIKNDKFAGKVSALKTPYTVDMGIADGTYPRIDVIAIQFSVNKNATEIVVKKGTPARTPVRPKPVRNGSIYELFLCSVLRPAGSTSISTSNITILRLDETVCGLMADSVTKINTADIDAQINSLLDDANTSLSNFMADASNAMNNFDDNSSSAFESFANNANIQFEDFQSESNAALDNLQNAINAIEAGTDTMLKSQWTTNGLIKASKLDQDVMLSSDWSVNGIIPISRGGTGKTTPSEALRALGGTEIKLLWENASPTSAFAAQTLTVSGIDDYDLYAVAYKAVSTENVLLTSASEVGKGIYLIANIPLSETRNEVVAGRRYCSYGTGGKLTIGAGAFGTYNNPQYIIPVKIYGIKL